MPTYDVQTARFGTVQKEADTIKDARTWAKTALGVASPRAVTRHADYTPCASCDCQPCVCPEAS